MKWTQNDVPSLSGKTIVITGANSGIGYESARICAENGAHTILACRDEKKGLKAVGKIREKKITGETETMLLNLGSLTSIRAFAIKLLSRFEHLDGLVNNAGIMMNPYQLTEDGFESQFGINHLGHFALTGLLMPALLSTPNARIVNVSSGAHSMGTMDFDNLMFEGGKNYTRIASYGRSKLANLLFTKGLQSRLTKISSGTIATSAHPGWASTNIGNQSHPLAGLIISVFGKLLAQSATMGALPTLRALLDPEALEGDYYGPDGFRESRGYPIKVSSSEDAQNLEIADRLWTVSENLTGVKYSWPIRS
jgi:NAD(P)-dependent dehydrogenase (short-subunit alcohol dehydrogenase family)